MNKNAENEELVKKATQELKPAHGVQEWAEHSVNIQTGCQNGCRYCYAQCQLVRVKQATPESWLEPVIRGKAIDKAYRKRNGRIMFPSSHDISPNNLVECLIVLRKLLEAGNEVLIVSKPYLSCIKTLCEDLNEFKQQILLRFTIGSTDDEVLRFWEPNAPSFAERLSALKYAHEQGFATSVSCEPMLDLHIGNVIEATKPYVTDTIWLGRANRLQQNIAINRPDDQKTKDRATQLLTEQSDDYLRELYARYKADPKIMFKDSIKKVVGLTQALAIPAAVQAETVQQVADLTKEYVEKLNKVGATEVTAWTEQGRLVSEFIKKIAPDGKPKRDPYKMLANHPDSAHQAQQLRNYHQSYTLYQELGGKEGAPKLPMTFFIAVIPKHITITQKSALLKQAQEENLSVSEHKKRVAQVSGKKTADPKLSPLANELQKFEEHAQKLFADFSSLIDAGWKSKHPDEVIASIGKALKPLIDHAIAQGCYKLDSEVSPKSDSGTNGTETAKAA